MMKHSIALIIFLAAALHAEEAKPAFVVEESGTINLGKIERKKKPEGAAGDVATKKPAAVPTDSQFTNEKAKEMLPLLENVVSANKRVLDSHENSLVELAALKTKQEKQWFVVGSAAQEKIASLEKERKALKASTTYTAGFRAQQLGDLDRQIIALKQDFAETELELKTLGEKFVSNKLRISKEREKAFSAWNVVNTELRAYKKQLEAGGMVDVPPSLK